MKKDMYTLEVNGNVEMDGTVTIKGKQYKIGYISALGGTFGRLGNVASIGMVQVRSGVTYDVYMTKRADGTWNASKPISMGK